ncbi:cbb3-type cytochrome c oxidase subunit I [Thalassobacillus hwangdonensis]|uniref:Cbb3-type cytochrome c oxidase subunit I n=1 Tax=Thalassobacillus hwangdonensis TaxID=546108 RepID=A0ABW3KX06_9BACI
MGIRLIKISAVYFLLGAGLGYYMAVVHDYSLTPVHAHINLLGWTALTLAGIIYHLFPAAAASKLGKWHFWLHNIGLPIMMGGLALFTITENPFFAVFISIGATVVLIAILLFVINVFTNVKE